MMQVFLPPLVSWKQTILNRVNNDEHFYIVDLIRNMLEVFNVKKLSIIRQHKCRVGTDWLKNWKLNLWSVLNFIMKIKLFSTGAETVCLFLA